MKTTRPLNVPARLAKVVLVPLVAIGAANSALAATNILTNRDFEINALTADYTTLTGSPQLLANQNRWAAQNGTLLGGNLLVDGVDPIDSQMVGMKASTSVADLTTKMVQIKNLTDFVSATEIDTMLVNYCLQGLFNQGLSTVSAIAGVTAYFYDAAGVLINTATTFTPLDNILRTWEEVNLIGTVPMNARFIGAEMFFQDNTLVGQQAFVDNTTLELKVVPEPSGVVLLGLGGSLLLLRRRK